MTTSATIPTRHNFTGNDVATSFSYTVKISNQAHIKLVHTDSAGVENGLADPPVVDVDYTVNGVGDTGGGTVDFPKAGSVYSTLATGEKLSILYVFPLEQQTDLPNTGRVFNESVEDQLDYNVHLTNQLKEKIDRSIQLVLGSTLTDIFFPEGTSADNRKLKGSRWNNAGTALELVSLISSTNVDPVAVKGDLIQGDDNGDAGKLAIGGTGAILSVVSGLLAYTAIGSTNDTLQVVGGVPAWVTNPTIADFTNATHDHADAAGGGNTLLVPTIASFANAAHNHLNAAGGGTLGSPVFSANSGTTDQAFATGVSEEVDFGTEVFDTNSDFASNTFTPQVAGKYFLTAAVRIEAVADQKFVSIDIRKGGSVLHTIRVNTSGVVNISSMINAVVEANGSTDAFTIWLQHNHGSDRNVSGSTVFTYFMGFKIAE